MNGLPSGRETFDKELFLHFRNHLGLLHPGSSLFWEYLSGAGDDCSSSSQSAISGDKHSNRIWHLHRLVAHVYVRCFYLTIFFIHSNLLKLFFAR